MIGDPMQMCLPVPGDFKYSLPVAASDDSMYIAGTANGIASGSVQEDPSKKVRKPYTITKSRESWTELEHDKFLEALQLFDRDWKKIEAFVGSKTVIQIRSHAQKYFLKVEKNGTSEHVPPPRPKRKAVHPYPQKAAKNGAFQSTSLSLDHGQVLRPDSLSYSINPISNAALSPWTSSSVPPASVQNVAKEFTGLGMVHNCCSSSNESTPRVWQTGETNNQGKGKRSKTVRVIPDFAQVYRFIGSVFDPSSTDHLQKLKKMDPINVETVLLLMKNLSANLMSPEFENLKRLLLSYDDESEKVKSSGVFNNPYAYKPVSAIPSMLKV